MTGPAGHDEDAVYVVYQMGKVGSSSVHESLRRAAIGTLHKVHYLADEGLATARRRYSEFATRLPVPYEETSEHVRALLRAGSPTIRWKVVTLVREPIARDVSAYIQMVDLTNPDLVAGDEPQVGRIARAVAAQFIGFDETTNYTCRWFDDEFRRVFGLDVFSYPFDHARGWQRITQGALDVLVLRLEDLDRVFEEALFEFTGKRVPLIYMSSRSPTKLQAAYRQDVYQQVLSRVRISELTCRSVYQSRYARHFYTPAELAAFQDHWSRSTQLRERA